MWWSDTCGFIELNITKSVAQSCSHSGQCDNDVAIALQLPAIKRQFNKLNPDTIAKVLKEYGAWDENELANHDDNKSRLLWIACGDIVDNL